MNEEQLFELMNFWQKQTLDLLDLTNEEEADVILEGFSNNLRWNLGHILISLPGLVMPRIGENFPYPKEYLTYFNRGTSPKDWTDTPPSLNEIKEKMEAQTELIKQHVTGKCDQPLEKPFMGMTTVGGLLAFAINHEVLHIGTILGMRKVVTNRN